MSDRGWEGAGPWLSLCRAVLGLASRALGREDGAAWRAEWEGELWALDRRGVGRAALLRFALDGALDATRTAMTAREDGMGGRGLGHDVRMALRRLRRAPGFTAVTVAVLALGIGANTALFGALRAALLQAPPYPDPERLVMVDLLVGPPGGVPDTLTWSWPKYRSVRDGLDPLEASAAYARRTVTLGGEGGPSRVEVEVVSPAYFALLGVGPAAGRLLAEDEAPPASPRVLVLAHDAWISRWGGDPGVVGRTVDVEGEPFRVVGVARAGFRGLTGSAEGWVSVADAPVVWEPRRLERARSHWFHVVGRLADGVEPAAAAAAVARLGPGLTEAFPSAGDEPVRQGVALTPLVRARVNPVARLAVGAVGAGAVLLLLIAGANVAGLHLARMAARRGDVAIRAAVGASRGRLAREVLAESLLLAGAGGFAGVGLALLAEGGVRWAVSWALDTSGSRGLQFLDPEALSLDGTVLAAGLVLALLTGLAFGLAPARAAGRTGLAGDLGRAGRASPGATGPGGGAGETARRILVGAQVALTLLLLSGAGLMLASFARLDAVALGFDAEGVLTARFDLGSGVPADEIRAFESGLVAELEALPDVESAATAVCAPLAGPCDLTGVRQIDDRVLPDRRDGAWIHTQSVAPGFFRTAGVPVVRGSALPEGLGPEDPPVAVLSRSAAAAHFPGVDPVGHAIGVTHSFTPEGRPARVIGVVEDVVYGGLEEGPLPTVYFSARQAPAGWGQVLVRSVGDPAALADDVRRVVGSLRSGMPVFDVTTLEARRAATTARTRVILGLLAAFGLTALLLSAVGLWGLVSWSVSRRTREVGLRMALGAGGGRILAGVVTGPVLLALAGGAAGVAAALWLNRYLEALLFGVEPGSPGVLAGALAVLLAVATVAAGVPALRAARVDPAEALRSE